MDVQDNAHRQLLSERKVFVDRIYRDNLDKAIKWKQASNQDPTDLVKARKASFYSKQAAQEYNLLTEDEKRTLMQLPMPDGNRTFDQSPAITVCILLYNLHCHSIGHHHHFDRFITLSVYWRKLPHDIRSVIVCIHTETAQITTAIDISDGHNHIVHDYNCKWS